MIQLGHGLHVTQNVKMLLNSNEGKVGNLSECEDLHL